MSIAPYATSLLLAFFVLVLIKALRSRKRKEALDEELPEPPGPKPWPVIGSLHLMGRHEVPYKVFGELAEEYKCPIVKLRLGSVTTVVVNGVEHVKSVLCSSSSHFDSRPRFERFEILFGGSRDNCEFIFDFEVGISVFTLVASNFCAKAIPLFIGSQ